MVCRGSSCLFGYPMPLDTTCMTFKQNQWVFCTGMFVAGLTFCSVLYVIAYFALKPWLTRRGLKPIDVEDAAIRVVSVVHALWVALPFTYALATESLPTTFTSHFPCATFVISASLGYFAFDTVALLHYSHCKGKSWKADASMFVHHFFAAGGEWMTLVRHVGGNLVAALMLSEYTTPMLHLLYVLERASYLGDNLLTKLMCAMFIILWIVFRIGVSAYFVVYLVKHWSDFVLLSLSNRVLYISVTIFFNCINLFWFYKILQKGARMASKTPRNAAAKKAD
ncbi:TLC domain-containing protein [Plasmodiophora brassicae]|uniref:TLC domain-containing protein n=1 Tax=Plasmodiophora brassicae TaxID=37360 RepID=A0A0G4IGU2_PLABS|nr:hypothetical protein PBRA_000110 [Plasmodiophora brassicae]SPQ96674.1 unnamed protein product [Plasmodiophora brassicae]